MGFKVEFQHLECGDIKITEEVLIERKTSRDLLNSITDGRLLKKCHNLINNCQYPLLLIELGEVGSAVHPNAVLGAMAHITLDIGIPVMMTKNTLESAHFLSISAKRKYDIFEELKKSANEILDERDIKSKLESAKKEIEIMISDESYQSPLLERWKIEALENKVEIICKITGLELETSRIILSHFGSIAAFMTASKKQLTEINGIDDISAEQIISSIEQL
jgi:Fanconi anemia group M protein